jgi:hypothetical protein
MPNFEKNHFPKVQFSKEINSVLINKKENFINKSNAYEVVYKNKNSNDIISFQDSPKQLIEHEVAHVLIKKLFGFNCEDFTPENEALTVAIHSVFSSKWEKDFSEVMSSNKDVRTNFQSVFEEKYKQDKTIIKITMQIYDLASNYAVLTKQLIPKVSDMFLKIEQDVTNYLGQADTISLNSLDIETEIRKAEIPVMPNNEEIHYLKTKIDELIKWNEKLREVKKNKQ